MQVWIRNQNRKGLKLVRNLAVKRNKVIGYAISMGLGAPDQSVLGAYETEERALAVLDFIQRKMESSPGGIVVLEMPKE